MKDKKSNISTSSSSLNKAKNIKRTKYLLSNQVKIQMMLKNIRNFLKLNAVLNQKFSNKI
jgi:hypothetical protein